ncbi:MAG: TetR family transcriptional regulator C-terminal domain-containing protein [Steroidobacteraceae bacterium]
MKRATKKSPAAAPAPRARSSNSRQRQRLIEACISALHVYGPSRTTVEKVVAIAKMSPGIVRFYFDSKAAMLVASLQYLASEFEERLLVPVARLEGRPVAALELMVDLYLDPDLASPRKVSVWYAFWGEASSRQEYYDICGKKDERFAALVRALVERLIQETRQSQLDPDSIALGLIGVLEILWQGFAFQTEATIDRAAAKRRCMAYLRSIFPSEFTQDRLQRESRGEPLAPDRNLPRWSYDDAGLAAVERADLFSGSWQFVGHRQQFAHAGDYLAVDIGADRVLLVHDEAGAIHALRDCCPEVPHRLSSGGEGRLAGALECRVHGLEFAFDGSRRPRGAGPNLVAMDLDVLGDLMFVRASGAYAAAPSSVVQLAGRDDLPMRLIAPQTEISIAADWKIVVEQWLGSALPDATAEFESSAEGAAAPSSWSQARLKLMDPSQFFDWSGMLAHTDLRWSGVRYRSLAVQYAARESQGAGGLRWRRWFLPPNQMIELRPDGLSVLQSLPTGVGRTRVRRSDYTFVESERAARALKFLAERLAAGLRLESLGLAQSIQQGIVAFGYAPAEPTRPTRAQGEFRAWLRRRIPSLRRDQGPTSRP